MSSVLSVFTKVVCKLTGNRKNNKKGKQLVINARARFWYVQKEKQQKMTTKWLPSRSKHAPLKDQNFTLIFIFGWVCFCFVFSIFYGPFLFDCEYFTDIIPLHFDIHYCIVLYTVRWNEGRVEKNPTQYWTLSGISRIYKHCIKL